MADRERSRSPDPAPAPAEAPAPAGGADANGDFNGHEPSGNEVKLYVGNLDYATNEDRLRQEFGQFGTVTDVFLPVERGTQRPRGFGFVTMSQRSEAENAISKMDQSQLDGRTIRVNESRPRGEGGGASRSGVGGSGFNASGKEEVRSRGKISDQCWFLHLYVHNYGCLISCFLVFLFIVQIYLSMPS
jgi:cold-inducible RNA-binding protein